jgi:hypothetical protein
MKILKIIFLVLLIFLISNMIIQFVINVRYSFSPPRIFSGENFYNPYQKLDSTKWERGNFHLHTKMLMGMTAGSKNSVRAADSLYKYFGYDISCVSDYMRINRTDKSDPAFIPVYEHGYQYYKTHQLVINANIICWKDYLFHQTLDNKQYIINCLKRDTGTLVVIVHPKLRNSYSLSDFRYLGSYDCIEIADSKFKFVRYYDSALSAGRKVFLMTDDDSHDISNFSDCVKCFNVINGGNSRHSTVQALRKGRSYGVIFNELPYTSNSEKKAALQNLPVVQQVDVRNDTLIIKVNKKVQSITYIGQNGIVKQISENCDQSRYKLAKNDTYIRTEIVCMDGSVYYLNPVFRYGSELPENIPAVNVVKTSAYRIVFFVIVSAVILSLKNAQVSNKVLIRHLGILKD